MRPAGLAPAVTARLNSEVVRALNAPDVRDLQVFAKITRAANIPPQ
jgi:hypothetical protein